MDYGVRCDECGFVYAEHDHADAAIRVRALAAAIVDRLGGLDDQSVRARVAPDVWSPLEYACHVRDVLLVQRERVLTARRVDDPTFLPMGRDERVAHDGYAEQDPVAVARQLGDAAALFTNVLDRLDPDDWQRRLVYNWPETFSRSVGWVAVHTVHELWHHLGDIERSSRG